MNTLNEFVKKTKLKPETQLKIKRFIENNHRENHMQVDQEKLLEELPSNLRAEVVTQTHGEIINKIKFFENKDPDFLWSILPLLKQMKVYPQECLYNQADHADEIFFIVHGRVKIYYDLNEGFGDPDNHPFNLYVEGSYFGDSDILTNDGKDGRDGTAKADSVSHL